MFEFLRYKKELRRIRKVQKTVAKKYERDLEGANKRGGDAYELQMIDQYYLGNDAEGDHWINWIRG